MRRLARWLDVTVGYRGSFLLVLGLVDGLVALSIACPPDPIVASSQFRFLRDIAPLGWWAAAWLLTALVCVVFAFRRVDWPGFAAAALLKVGWILLLLYGWRCSGVDRGWVSAASWAVAACMVLRISAWPEPQRDKSGRVIG